MRTILSNYEVTVSTGHLSRIQAYIPRTAWLLITVSVQVPGKPSNGKGAIQVLRNVVGGGVSDFPKKALRRCTVWNNIITITKGGVGVKFPGKNLT